MRSNPTLKISVSNTVLGYITVQVHFDYHLTTISHRLTLQTNVARAFVLKKKLRQIVAFF